MSTKAGAANVGSLLFERFQLSLDVAKDYANRGFTRVHDSGFPARVKELRLKATEALNSAEIDTRAREYSDVFKEKCSGYASKAADLFPNDSVSGIKARCVNVVSGNMEIAKQATAGIRKKFGDSLKASSGDDQTSNGLANLTTKFKTFKKNIFREYKVGKVKFSRVFNSNELYPGDHIVIGASEHGDVYAHAIVVSCESLASSFTRLTLVAYCDSVLFEKVFEPLNAQLEDPSELTGILAVKVVVCFKTTFLGKPVYPKLDKQIVLERAVRSVGTKEEILYDSIGFVNYCLTGQKGILVIIDPKTFSKEGLKSLGLSSSMISNIVETGATIGVLTVGKAAIAAGSKASSVKALNTFGNFAGPTIGAAVEVGQTGVKIAKKKRQKDAGQMPESAYQEEVTKNVTKAAHSIAGGIMGSIVGEIVIPIPVLGAIAGGIVGGLIGEAIGSANGAVLGRAVGVINSAVKCSKVSGEEARAAVFRKQNNDNGQDMRYFLYRPSREGTQDMIHELSDLSDIQKAVEHDQVDVYKAQI